MMSMLLEHAQKIREGYKYSADEKMIPTAFILSDPTIEVIAMQWKDNKEKYRMAAMVNHEARRRKAKSLSFVTDTRWVEGATFAEYFKLDDPQKMGMDEFQRTYHRILAAHGGEVKNLPRQLWKEAITVFTNGPDFPLTVQMASYEEGPNDSIIWLPPQLNHDGYKSDLLTDWWS